MGCGSGVVTTFFRSQWKQQKQQMKRGKFNSNIACQRLLSFVTDINAKALDVTRQTDEINNYGRRDDDDDVDPREGEDGKGYDEHEDQEWALPLEAIHCDLATALLPRWQHQVDVILFNPPYVPSADDDDDNHPENNSSTVSTTSTINLLAAAWDGGPGNGRQVIDRAIPQIEQLLRQTTGVAYLVTIDENQPQQVAQSIRPTGLLMTPWFRRKARNEYLTVHKITWQQQGRSPS